MGEIVNLFEFKEAKQQSEQKQEIVDHIDAIEYCLMNFMRQLGIKEIAANNNQLLLVLKDGSRFETEKFELV